MKPGQRTAGGARSLPGHYYTSSAIFAQEFERIFTKRWLYVGRASEIATVGDFLLFDLAPTRAGPEPVPHESIIVVRGSDAEVRSFYNVCRHRGARMCSEAGRGQTIRCPYHAWTYALDGRLIGAPNMADVAGFSREDYPLRPVATAVWEGFVFINLADEPVPFAEAFAPIHDKLGPWQLDRLVLAQEVEYEVAANWKLLFENYAECYHCPVIHPALNSVTPYRGAHNDLESGEILGGPMQISEARGSMTKSGRLCGPLLVSGELLAQVYYYTFLPNLFLSLHPDYVLIHRLDPVAIDRTRVRCAWLFDPSYREQPGCDPQEAVVFWDRVNKEDWQVCELSQHGVRSRAYAPGPYAELESVSAAFDRAYLEVIEA